MKFNAEGDARFGAKVLWLKNKKDTIDLLVDLRNEYPHPVTLRSNSFALDFGGRTVGPQSDSIWVTLAPGMNREQLLIFKLGQTKPPVGPATFTVKPLKGESQELPGITVEMAATRR